MTFSFDLELETWAKNNNISLMSDTFYDLRKLLLDNDCDLESTSIDDYIIVNSWDVPNRIIKTLIDKLIEDFPILQCIDFDQSKEELTNILQGEINQLHIEKRDEL